MNSLSTFKVLSEYTQSNENELFTDEKNLLQAQKVRKNKNQTKYFAMGEILCGFTHRNSQ